jgi:hypothetical protein
MLDGKLPCIESWRPIIFTVLGGVYLPLSPLKDSEYASVIFSQAVVLSFKVVSYVERLSVVSDTTFITDNFLNRGLAAYCTAILGGVFLPPSPLKGSEYPIMNNTCVDIVPTDSTLYQTKQRKRKQPTLSSKILDMYPLLANEQIRNQTRNQTRISKPIPLLSLDKKGMEISIQILCPSIYSIRTHGKSPHSATLHQFLLERYHL